VRLRPAITLTATAVALLGGVLHPRVDAALTPDAEGCPHSTDVPTPEKIELTRAAILCLLNAERAKHGLPPLRHDPLLELASQRHSEDMAARNFFEHETPEGVDPQARMTAVEYTPPWTGENLYWGEGTQALPVKALEGWMNSPGHRANILRQHFSEVGVGVAYDAPRRGVTDRAAVYTTDFGG
jgi:uncharacterized protein YkwD